jgi:hypothetical protein
VRVDEGVRDAAVSFAFWVRDDMVRAVGWSVEVIVAWWLNVDERDGKGGDVGVLLLYSFCPIRRLVWKKQEDSPATPVMGRGKFMSHPAYVIERGHIVTQRLLRGKGREGK